MNLRLLQIFQTVCEEGNITKAAQRLYMTQPAVSHAIHDLEKELHVQMFDRFGKRIYLNETGRTFLLHAQSVLHSYDELVRHIPQLEEEACIRIGASSTIANDLLPDVLQKFASRFSSALVQVHVDSAVNIMDSLYRHAIDFALVEGAINHGEWSKILLSSSELQVVCGKEHSLHDKDTIAWEDVSNQVWLLREKGSAARDTFDSACQIKQIQINPAWTSVNSQVLLQAVRANLGITILPESIIDACPCKEQLHILHIGENQLHCDHHIVYNKGLLLNQPMSCLFDLLQGK